MAKGNVFGPATSEIGFRGFADGKGISSPGAVAPKEKWYEKAAALATASVSDKMFDYLRTPTVSEDVVKPDMDVIYKNMEDTNRPIAEDLGNQLAEINKLKGLTYDEDNKPVLSGIDFDKERLKLLEDQYMKDLAAASDNMINSEKATTDYVNNTSYFNPDGSGYRIVDPRIDMWGFRPQLKPGYVYRSDLNKPENVRDRESFFDGIGEYFDWSK